MSSNAPEITCPRCNTRNPGISRFCNTCGLALTNTPAPTAPAVAPKPRSRARPWLIGCGGFFALVILCGVFNNLTGNTARWAAERATATAEAQARSSTSAATPRPTSTLIAQATDVEQVTPSREAPSAAPATIATTPPEPTAIPEPTATATVQPTPTDLPTPTPLPAIGQDVQIDELRWKIIEATDAGKAIPSSNSLIKDATTPGRFIRVRVEVENLSKEEESYDGFILIDNQGREFNEWRVIPDTAFVPGDEACGSSAPLRPNIPRMCQLIFEVADDAHGLKAKIYPGHLFTMTLAQEIDLGF